MKSKQLNGICPTYLGCCRLEDANFEGANECKNYVKRKEYSK